MTRSSYKRSETEALSGSGHPPMATLGLFSETLDPVVINGILALAPDVAARKGDIISSRQAASKPVHAKTGTWFITSTKHVFGNPADHLDWLVTLAVSHVDQLRAKFPDIQIDFSLLVFDVNFNPSDLPSSLLERAVDLGELEIEIPEKPADFLVNSSNVQNYTRH